MIKVQWSMRIANSESANARSLHGPCDYSSLFLFMITAETTGSDAYSRFFPGYEVLLSLLSWSCYHWYYFISNFKNLRPWTLVIMAMKLLTTLCLLNLIKLIIIFCYLLKWAICFSVCRYYKDAYYIAILSADSHRDVLFTDSFVKKSIFNHIDFVYGRYCV